MAAPRFRPPVLRRSQALLAHRGRWRARAVFWLGALTVGLVGTGFAWAADLASATFLHLSGGGRSVWLLAVLPLAFIASALVAQRWFPGAQGSGIPQAIAARELEGRERRLYLSPRIAVGKIVLTLWGLLFGASIGREGPTVQVGAAIMLASARLGGLRHGQGLILAGSAAGIAAAFNTPLAGIVFAIEEMSRSYQARTNGIVLSTVVIAGLAAMALSGSYTYFGAARPMVDFPRDWLLVGVIGLTGGVLGAGFSRSTLVLTRRIRRWRAPGAVVKTALVAGTAGLIVAGLGLASAGSVFGTSYHQASVAVGGEALSPWFFPAKLLATLASTVAGIPGGLFAPSLSVGAGIGNAVALLLGGSLSFAAVLGMASYFAGVVQSPMTAFVIVMEMTATQNHALPLMAAALLGYGVSRLLSPEPLYHGLARLWLADALRQQRAREAEGAAAGRQG